MKAKTLIIPAMGCVSLFAGCTFQTAHDDMWTVKPTMHVTGRAENPQAWYDLGRYYQGQERHDQAVWALEKAVAADGTFAEAHNRLAVSYALLGRQDDAIRQFEAAIRLAPEAAHVYSNLGYVQYLKGNYIGAVSALERAVALDPSNRRALNNLGMAYAQLDDEAKARLAFAKAAASAPPTAAAPPAKEPPVVTRQESRTQVVRLAPNVYELRQQPAASPAAPGQMASGPAAPSASTPLSHVRVEVSNGNGVNNMARQVGAYLKGNGLAVTRLTNQQSFDVPTTRVEYRGNYEAAARQVAATIPQGAEITMNARLRQDIGVRLVLGRDLARKLGYFEQRTEPTRLAQGKP